MLSKDIIGALNSFVRFLLGIVSFLQLTSILLGVGKQLNEEDGDAAASPNKPNDPQERCHVDLFPGITDPVTGDTVGTSVRAAVLSGTLVVPHLM